MPLLAGTPEPQPPEEQQDDRDDAAPETQVERT